MKKTVILMFLLGILLVLTGCEETNSQILIVNNLNSPLAIGTFHNHNLTVGINDTRFLTIDISKNITFHYLNGSGNAFACLDSNGRLYRSVMACA